MRRNVQRPFVLVGALLAGLAGGCASPSGANSEGGGGLASAANLEQRESTVESNPAGASVFVDGGFVGTTPATFHMPAKSAVELRLEFPGYFPADTTVYRQAGVPSSAEEGVGWEPVYFYELKRKQ